MNEHPNNVQYKKSQIALMQLSAACKLFFDKDYVSSLTLAGASNEVIMYLCRARGIAWRWNLPAELQEELLSVKPEDLEKFLIKLLNETRNKLKHHSSDEDEIVNADFYFEAQMFILSTIENYKELFGKLPEDETIRGYWEKFKPIQGNNMIDDSQWKDFANKVYSFRSK